MVTDNLMQIIDSFTINGASVDPKFTCEFLESAGKTIKFDLVLKFLTKSEKKSNLFNKEIKTLIENLK